MTTAEHMAMAVLQGDMTAARALADMLLEDIDKGVLIPHTKKITSDINKVRVVVFFPCQIDGIDVEIDQDGLRDAIENWITGGGPLVLVGADRLELYELH